MPRTKSKKLNRVKFKDNETNDNKTTVRGGAEVGSESDNESGDDKPPVVSDADGEEQMTEDPNEIEEVTDEGEGEGDDDEEGAEGADVADEELGDIDGGRESGEDDCSYNSVKRVRGVKKVSANIDKDDDDDDEGIAVNIDENEVKPDMYVKPDERISGVFMTNYERVRLLGDRTAQLAQGAKPMLKGVESMEPKVIAQLELESGMMPIRVIRPLPNGKKEMWTVRELKLKKNYVIYGFVGGFVDKNSIVGMEKEYKKGGGINGYTKTSASVTALNNQIDHTVVDVDYPAKIKTKKNVDEVTKKVRKTKN
jgi:DNA-directed RNA polymerase subunit K/omega